MASTAANNLSSSPKQFSSKDLFNLQLLSQLNRRKDETLEKLREATSADEKREGKEDGGGDDSGTCLTEKLQVEEDAKQAVRDLTKFLSLFAEGSASARLLYKEQQPLHIEHIARTVRAEAAIMRRIHGDSSDAVQISGEPDLKAKLMELPHIKSAFDLTVATAAAASSNQASIGGGAPNKQDVASIKDKFVSINNNPGGGQNSRPMEPSKGGGIPNASSFL